MGTGRGSAVLGHCPNSVLGPVAIGGASGWTLVWLPWGPGAAPLCFCSREALLLVLVCWVCPRELELGAGIWRRGHPSQSGGPQNEQPSSSLAAEAASHGAPRTHFWLLGPPASWGVRAFGFSVPRHSPLLQAPGYMSLVTFRRGRALLSPVPAARAVGSKTGLGFRPRMCLRRGRVFNCYRFCS